MSEHNRPIAAKMSDRWFFAVQLKERWVGDTTDLLAGRSRLSLAALSDLFSRILAGDGRKVREASLENQNVSRPARFPGLEITLASIWARVGS